MNTRLYIRTAERTRRERRIWSVAAAAMAMTMTTTLTACGDGGTTTATAGATEGSSSTAGGPSSTSTTVTEGSNSLSDSATEASVGSNSMSDSQVSMTTPTSTDSVSDTATAGTTDSATATSGAMTGSTGDTGAGDTTVGVDTGTGAGTGTSTGGSTGGPAMCGAPPKGFNGDEDPACEIAPIIGKFNPVLEWSKSTWAAGPTFTQVMAAPIVVSLTDDNADGKINELDVPDIVFSTFAGGAYQAAGWLRAVSGDDGKEIFNIGNQGITGAAGVAGGDIDNDGIVELVTVTTGGLARAFEHDGTLKWTSPAIAADPYSYPAIADMDGDGTPEIVVGKSILNNDGTLRATVKYGHGARTAVVTDIDGKSGQELVGGNAIYGADGKEKWYNALSDGYIGVADFDIDSNPDIVVVSGGRVRLQDGLGKVMWDVAFPGAGGGPPTIADYDGDGNPEIGVAGKLNYAVFKADGAVLWQKPTQDASSQSTGSSVYDFEGDGAAEAVYNDEVRLRVYAGGTGAEKLNILGHGSGTIHEYPLVVDVDNDGQAEIVVVNNNYAYGTKAGVSVYGDQDKSWRPARKIWNQHAYFITNVNDDGTIPASPIPNYKAYNSFRSGDLAPPDGTKVPDLTLEVPELCTLECVDSKLILWVHVGNEGASPLTAGGTLDVHGAVLGVDTPLGTTELVDVINAGSYIDAIAYVLDPTDLESITITVSAKEQECNLGNNEVVLQGPFCQ
jgi:hypothetical protein